MVYLNEVSKAKEKERFMFEGSESFQVALPVFKGEQCSVEGECEVCPPQDELNLSRSEEFTTSKGEQAKGR